MTRKPTKEVDTELIDLDALDRPAGKVKLLGEERVVQAIDAAGYRTMKKIQEDYNMGGFPDVDKMYELAGQCCPSLSPEQVSHLKMEQVSAIIAIAGNRVDAVKKFAEQVSKNANVATGSRNGKPKA